MLFLALTLVLCLLSRWVIAARRLPDLGGIAGATETTPTPSRWTRHRARPRSCCRPAAGLGGRTGRCRRVGVGGAGEGGRGDSGVRRDPASTPTEFVVQVLDRTAADRSATRSLLAAYERARFSGLPITGEDVERAAADLGQGGGHAAARLGVAR